MALLLKLNGFITSIYIPFIEDIPPSVTLSAYKDVKESKKSSNSKDENERNAKGR